MATQIPSYSVLIQRDKQIRAIQELYESKSDSDSVYTKTEIDAKIGNIDAILDEINGEVI
jgi:hypothetical protein